MHYSTCMHVLYIVIIIVNQAGMVLSQARIDGKSIIKLIPKYTLINDYVYRTNSAILC